MYNDSLFRVSFKCLIRNANGEILVVKENSRPGWDLPGGGMDHGETIEESMARELYEEVLYDGPVAHRVIGAQDPLKLVTRDVWQLRIVAELLDVPADFPFAPGIDGEEVRFANPAEFVGSEHISEQMLAGLLAK